MDSEHLCGNVEEVLEVSQNLLTLLETATHGHDFNQQLIGRHVCHVTTGEAVVTIVGLDLMLNIIALIFINMKY